MRAKIVHSDLSDDEGSEVVMEFYDEVCTKDTVYTRLAIATFRRIFQHDGKISPS
jgi:hypothetical protein